MRIACRWPGGMTIAITGGLGSFSRPVILNGPPGTPSVLPSALARGAPSRDVATLAQKAVADTVKRMTDTSHGDYDQREYGVTDVPGDYWNAWYAQNAGNDVITQKMVFSLEG